MIRIVIYLQSTGLTYVRE